MRFFSRTSVRTFTLYPIIALVWELVLNPGNLNFDPLFLPLMFGAICSTGSYDF